MAATGAVLLTGFALVKAYAVAHFSLTTGAALLTSAPVSVLLGALMSYAYWIFPLVSLAGLLRGLRTWKGEGWSGQTAALIGVALFSALLSPVRQLLVITLAFALFLVVFRLPAIVDDRRRSDGLPPRTWPRPWVRLGRTSLSNVHTFLVVAVFWVVLASLTQPWVPVEVVGVRNGQGDQFIVGNVLSADGEWTTLMRAGNRGLSRVRSGDVVTRRLCHLSGAQPPGRAPLLSVLQGQPYRSPNTSCARLVAEEPTVPVAAGSFPD